MPAGGAGRLVGVKGAPTAHPHSLCVGLQRSFSYKVHTGRAGGHGALPCPSS